ncbi:MAG: HipA N-terminal domain-containing protein [Pirellula sp.]
MSRRQGLVRIDWRDAGILTESEQGYSFRYFTAWLATEMATPISLTMPLREAAYTSKVLHPFFQNLLPEGWLLEIATKKLKLSKDDPFGLLLATCADCIGAVEIIDTSMEAAP